MYKKLKTNRLKFTLGLILLLSLNISSFASYLTPLNKNFNVNEELKSSGVYYDILIDDLPSSLKNWSWAETQPWFGGGSGTLGDPYIIENHKFEYSAGSGVCFSILNSIKHFIINNCTFRNSSLLSVGFKLDNVTNGQISNSHFYDNGADGIELLDSNEILILNNEIYDNDLCGIFMWGTSENNIITRNNFDHNTGVGVEIFSSNNLFYNNSFTNPNIGQVYDWGTNDWNNTIIGNYWDDYTGYDMDLDGIGDTPYDVPPIGGSQDFLPKWNLQAPITIDDLPSSLTGWSWAVSQAWCSGSGTEIDPYIIENLNIDGNNTENCISIENSEVQFIITSCTVYNAGPSQPDAGIYLNNVTYGNIGQNNCSNNGYAGIHLYDCDNNIISGNTVNSNIMHGIVVRANCHHINISENTLNKNNWDGIHIVNSHNNTISQNTISDNINNDMAGVYLSNSRNNTIYENNIYSNYYGIDLYLSDYNIIFENIFNMNNRCGIYIDDGDGGSHNNLLYRNFFLKNVIHAIDDEPTNNWNNSYIGNYWDNWTGPDESPQDGIVDEPYNITGKANSRDFLPIADDGAPIITINSPSDEDIFGTTAPSFSVTITDVNLFEMWYTLDGGLHNYTFSDFTSSIKQSAWDSLSDGTITLTFFASDKPGNIGSAEVEIEKETVAPLIIIHSPLAGDEFGNTAPTFSITVVEEHLDSIWYSLDGGLPNFVDTLNGTIDQSDWSALSQGNVTITFFANDTLGNSASENVIVEKIIHVPGDDFTIVIITISIVSGAAVAAGVTIIILKKRKVVEEGEITPVELQD